MCWLTIETLLWGRESWHHDRVATSSTVNGTFQIGLVLRQSLYLTPNRYISIWNLHNLNYGPTYPTSRGYSIYPFNAIYNTEEFKTSFQTPVLTQVLQ